MALAEAAAEFAIEVLAQGGAFFCKPSKAAPSGRCWFRLKEAFADVATSSRPPAARESAEALCLGDAISRAAGSGGAAGGPTRGGEVKASIRGAAPDGKASREGRPGFTAMPARLSGPGELTPRPPSPPQSALLIGSSNDSTTGRRTGRVRAIARRVRSGRPDGRGAEAWCSGPSWMTAALPLPSMMCCGPAPIRRAAGRNRCPLPRHARVFGQDPILPRPWT